jgi:hypothetical protein
MKASQDTPWYILHGSYHTKAFGTVQRFTCGACGTGFSEQTFRLDYYVKRPVRYLRILRRLTSGCGIRDIGRHIGISHQAVLNRLARLARQATAVHAQLTSDLRLQENLVTDGFESFVASQYAPNNIHLLAGYRSQMLYSFDYAHLRRKGRMTEHQKREREKREQQLLHPRTTIYRSFTRIAGDLEELITGGLNERTVLYSDRRQEYKWVLRASPVLKEWLTSGHLKHVRISSRKRRTRENPLFAVNYLDRQIRKDCAPHVRETVEYSRNVNNCLAHMAVYQLQHNYRKPFRIDVPILEELRHAEVAGIARSRIDDELRSVFELRRFVTRVRLTYSQMVVWFRMATTSDRWDGGYFPHYVWM